MVKESLAGVAEKLTLAYIAESLGDEALTYEAESLKWSYPKTRANLAHVRKRLGIYYATEGYRERIIIKLNPGSYVPVIGYNPVTGSIPDIDPKVARLILRAKTAIDSRTLRGVHRALTYYLQIPLTMDNARQAANVFFIPMAAASTVPSAVIAIAPFVDEVLAQIKKTGAEPWELVFTEACAEACYKHQWEKALELFALSITLSQEEAKYHWWYTALLASVGRISEAITILDNAVNHFSRTNIAVRTDLALLQIMAGRFAEAEEHLSAALDFAPPDDPLLACHFAFLFEAQDRLDDTVAHLVHLFRPDSHYRAYLAAADGKQNHGDGYIFLSGMFALVMGRGGADAAATQMVDMLLEFKEKNPANSSVEVALGLIGLGRLNEAVEWLTKAAFEEHDPVAMWFHIFPPLRHLRGNGAYRQLLVKLDLSLQ